MKISTNPNINPIISIITVVYNGEETIKSTIESIIEQKNEDIEYIVINGNSSDKTGKILQDLSEHIDICITEKDNGIYDAMNKGLDLASGKFIWFINSGDQIGDNKIIKDLISTITDRTQYIYSGVKLINKQGETIKTVHAPNKITTKLISKGMCISHQSFIIKKTLTNHYDLTYKLIADQKWIMQCISKSTVPGEHFPRPLSKYLLGGLSDQNQTKCVVEKIKMIKKDYPEYFKSNIFGYIYELCKIKLKNYINLIIKSLPKQTNQNNSN